MASASVKVTDFRHTGGPRRDSYLQGIWAVFRLQESSAL